MPERTPSHPAISPNLSSPARDPKAGGPKPIPKTDQPSTPATRVKSFVRKILLASPAFPRLYADVVISSAPNSHEAKILAANYKTILKLSNRAQTNNERTNQPMANKSCTHIKVTGVRCGSPALRGEQFCYFHQRMLRTVRFPSSRVLRSALLEDPESIQASLMEVVNGLLRGTLELKRGELILRALNTAVRNIRHARFDLHQEDMIREIPNYPDPPIEQVNEQAATEVARQARRAEIERIRAAHLPNRNTTQDKTPAAQKPASPAHTAPPTAAPPTSLPAHLGSNTPTSNAKPTNVGTTNARTTNAATTNLGTAAPGCPGGPAVPGRSAALQKPKSTKPAAVIAHSAAPQKPTRLTPAEINRTPPQV